MKRYRVFLLAMTSVLLIVLGFSGWVVSNLNTVTVYAEEHQESEQELQFKTIEHIVKTGDTLWDIARLYRPGEDPRKVILELRQLNDIGKYIYPGQVLLVPGVEER